MAARPRPLVAIDGPAGAGKSTVSRRLAEALGFVLVDTGAMYRAVALAARDAGIPFGDGARAGALAARIVASRGLRFERDVDPVRPARVLLDGRDISDAIRTPEIGMGASTVSAHQEVRQALLDLQRQAGRDGGVVLEGRDIGTVVFPDAEVKFFLTARPEERARRRHAELVAKGQGESLEKTLEEVRRRDDQDTLRPVAPLRQADDAVVVDSTGRSVDEIVAEMAARVQAWRRA
jgi:cytidylate kinase